MLRRSSRRFGLNHDPSNKGLSDVTVQMNLFCSTLAVDLATGLPFPYHIQRLIDNEATKTINGFDNNSKKDEASSSKKTVKGNNKKNKKDDNNASSSLTSLKMKPEQFKYWVDEKWAKEIQKCANAQDQTFGDAVSVSPWKFSQTALKNEVNPNAKQYIQEKLLHSSWFEVTAEQKKEYLETLEKKKEKAQEQASALGYSSTSSDASAEEEYETAKNISDEDLLLKLLRSKSGTPRCGRSGTFFSRQDLAFSLAMSSAINGYKSPFWITSKHPGLFTSLPKKNSAPDAKLEPHLVVKADEKPTLASASMVVFPASRLGFSGEAAKSALSPQFLQVKGTKEASAMNAISGVSLSDTQNADFSEEAIDFFNSHPEFETDGWISFDQIMKLGLPLLSPTGGPKTGIFAGDLFDRGYLIEILKDVEYYNQEQLEKPGKLAMRRMPGAPPALL